MLRRVKVALQQFRVYRAARFGWQFVRDPVFRRDHVLLWRRPKRLYQHRSITAFDRYPAIFTFVQGQLRAVRRPRLLSFGCANGAEVFTLRAYFPSAFIKGIDINPANIAIARRRQCEQGNDPEIVFADGNSVRGEPPASYDAVFCMAVFIRWQVRQRRNVATCLPHLDFSEFERTVTELAACVRPGGLIILRNCLFRFSDTVTAAGFECMLRQPAPAGFFPQFGPDNLRQPDALGEEVVFRKLPWPGAAPLSARQRLRPA